MAVGKFDKEEAKEVVMMVTEMFAAIPLAQRVEFVDHFMNTMAFIFAAETAAPEEAKDE